MGRLMPPKSSFLSKFENKVSVVNRDGTVSKVGEPPTSSLAPALSQPARLHPALAEVTNASASGGTVNPGAAQGSRLHPALAEAIIHSPSPDAPAWGKQVTVSRLPEVSDASTSDHTSLLQYGSSSHSLPPSAPHGSSSLQHAASIVAHPSSKDASSSSQLHVCSSHEQLTQEPPKRTVKSKPTAAELQA